MTELAANKFRIRRTSYANAISNKFDNRRVTTIKCNDGGFVFEFSRIDPKNIAGSINEFHHGKLHVLKMSLTQEAAEIIMLDLAELMGFAVVEDMNKVKPI